MSKLFFDSLVNLEKVDKKLKKIAPNFEEREELWLLVDEMVHHKVMDSILAKLPRGSHQEFLTLFHSSPHDEIVIFDYLKRKIGNNIREIILQELGVLEDDIMRSISKT